MKPQHDQCNATCFSCRPSVDELILYLQNIFQTIGADPRTDPVSGWTPAVSNSAGRHLLGAANGRKLYKKNSRENSDFKFHMCLRAIKAKHYSQRIYLSSARSVGYNIASYRDLCFKQLSSFQNIRRKGGKFDHRATKGPATPLPHTNR